MRKQLIWIGLMAGIVAFGAEAERQPVLVELFTSEGCSSCPPADALLEKLDRAQPVAGAHIIALSEHVDYWNSIGWADPYSSPAFSARQQVYARRFGIDGPYTPQMVVDGRTEFVGSDGRKAESAIRSAIPQQKVAIRLLASTSGNPVIAVEVDTLPSGKANIYMAHAAEEATSDVLRGENKGRRLHHVSIAKELRQIGTIDQHSGFKTQLTLPPGADRLIVFAQERGNGRVWGAAMFTVSK
jgi:hypothetical protein